jgi:propionyl-CoA carboxylase alpha chain
VRLLRHPRFLAGATRTDFIDRHPEVLTGGRDGDVARGNARLAHLAAAVAATAARRRDEARVAGFAPPGWRLFPGPPRQAEWRPLDGEAVPVAYHLDDRTLRLTVDGREHQLGLRAVTAAAARVTVEGVEWGCSVHHTPDGTVWVNDPGGQTAWQESPRLPVPEAAALAGGTVSEMPGTVVAVLVEPGQTVAVGDPLVVLEAMKMEHRVTAPADGVVTEVRVAVGDRVDAHELLVVLVEG